MRAYKRKKIWLNEKKTKYCTTRLYRDKKEMQKYYDLHCDSHAVKGLQIAGASMHWVMINGLTKKVTGETGMVLLCMERTGAGVVSHEFLHAVLWAHKHHKHKKQHPIVIKNMKEEEEILHNLSYAVRQFYNWYWKVEKEMQPVKK